MTRALEMPENLKINIASDFLKEKQIVITCLSNLFNLRSSCLCNLVITSRDILRTLVELWRNNHVFWFSSYVICYLTNNVSKVALLIYAPVSKSTDQDFGWMLCSICWQLSLLIRFSPFTVQRWWSCPKNLGVHFFRKTKNYVPGSRMLKGSIAGSRGYSLLECCASTFNNTATKCLARKYIALKIISR